MDKLIPIMMNPIKSRSLHRISVRSSWGFGFGLVFLGQMLPLTGAEAASQKEATNPTPVTIMAGSEWIPLRPELEIEPGSALDFSRLGFQDAPAGKHGRVIARGSFGFECPPGVDPASRRTVGFSASLLDDGRGI